MMAALDVIQIVCDPVKRVVERVELVSVVIVLCSQFDLGVVIYPVAELPRDGNVPVAVPLRVIFC